MAEEMSNEPIEGESKHQEEKPILFPSMPTTIMFFEPNSRPIYHPDDPPCTLPNESYDHPIIDSEIQWMSSSRSP